MSDTLSVIMFLHDGSMSSSDPDDDGLVIYCIDTQLLIFVLVLLRECVCE